MDQSNLVWQGSVLGFERQFTPAEVGVENANMKSATTYNGNKLLCQGFKDFMVSITVTNVGGGAAGLVKLVVDLYGEDDTLLLGSFDLVTSINTKATNTVTVCFGRTNAAKLHYTSGTPALSASADILRIAARMRLSLTVTEANNGTTSTASVRLRTAA